MTRSFRSLAIAELSGLWTRGSRSPAGRLHPENGNTCGAPPVFAAGDLLRPVIILDAIHLGEAGYGSEHPAGVIDGEAEYTSILRIAFG